MKAQLIPVPPPPPKVTLEMTGDEARLILRLALLDVSIPHIASGTRGMGHAEVKSLLNSIVTALREAL